MAIIRVRTGGRGRPLEIDVEKTLKQFEQQLPRAKARLQEIRRTTSGVRDAEILGTETQLPKALSASIDVLEALSEGKDISYQTARELRQNLRSVEQLASRQERVFGRSLASLLTRQYEQDIKARLQNASGVTQRIYKRMLQRVQQLTPKQQQTFFFSRGYQLTSTQGQYQRVIEWAQNDIAEKEGINVKLTSDEALAYVEEQKQIAELGIEAEELEF